MAFVGTHPHNTCAAWAWAESPVTFNCPAPPLHSEGDRWESTVSCHQTHTYGETCTYTHLNDHRVDAAATRIQCLSPGIRPIEPVCLCVLCQTVWHSVRQHLIDPHRKGERGGERDHERETSEASRRLWRRENIRCRADGMIAGWSNR